MNVNDLSAVRACTSCGFCGAVCPTDAITIKLDDDGFYRPFIDESKCIDCSKCTRHCYRFDNNIRNNGTGNSTLYSATAKDAEILKNTTSGGIADILARRLIEKGYICIGVVYDSDSNRSIDICASTIAETEAFRGSKYIQSYSVDAFRTLVKVHKSEKFAIFGLPCQIYSISRFLEQYGDRNKHILIDLYCHGCPSMNLWDKYISEKSDKNPIVKAVFRSKKRGWGRYCIELETKNQTFISPKTGDSFFSLFFSDLVLNQSCSDCSLRSTLEYTDIRLGDFWGKEFLTDIAGVSAITTCSEMGENAFSWIKADINWEPKEFETFIPYQSFGKIYKIDLTKRRLLLDLLKDPHTTLPKIVKIYHKQLGLKANTIRIAKNMIKCLPIHMENAIRKFL